MLRIAHAGDERGARAMARDDHLVQRLRAGELAGRVVRIHGWSEPVVTAGRSQPLSEELMAAARRAGVAVVRRPTGGGRLLHLPGDLSVTLADSGPLGAGAFRATARLVARALAEGLRDAGRDARVFTGLARTTSRADVCFERADRDEVVVGETKAAGVALARLGRSVLVQTAIPLVDAPESLQEFAAEVDPKRAAAAVDLAGVDAERVVAGVVRSLAAGSEEGSIPWSWPETWEDEVQRRESERYPDLAAPGGAGIVWRTDS